MSDRDRNSSYPSYLIESLDHLHHYLNYRGRTYHDLKSLKHAVDELKLMIDTKLIRDFSYIPEVAKMLKKP